MRSTNERISIELKFPYDRPDANGVVYSKHAIKQALKKGVANLPILFADDTGYEKVIGVINGDAINPEWDDANGVCKCTVNGVVFYAGTSCEANEIKDRVISDFTITSIGLSV